MELKEFVKRGQEKCGEIRGGGCMYFEFWEIWQKLINFGMGLCFNIAPRQERYMIYKKEGRLHDVSHPCSPRGDDSRLTIGRSAPFSFQSTSPSGDDDLKASMYLNYKEVSIHVPKRGRQKPLRSCNPRPIVSIHVPKRGRQDWSKTAVKAFMFQSTSPSGDDV